jgi:DNA-binding SARP family transcriptional activator/Tfp pilus assembly protein PilF
MRFGLLGPLLVHDGEELVEISAPRQRTVLAALLVEADQAVPADKLAEAVWDGRPPAAAAVTLRTHVMRLRQVLGMRAAARVATRSGCYRLDASADEVDHLLFAALCSQGGAAVKAGAWQRADRALTDALGLWRGPPMADIASESLRFTAVPHLEELRLQALEWRNDARLSGGQHSELIIEVQALAAENPLRERFHAQLMLSLYRCGRQADALAAFQHARRLLVEELGIEPGPELRELHQRMLAADRSLEVGNPATALSERADAVPHQLPAAISNFTGRQPEIDALTSALELAGSQPARPVLVISAVSGTAGVGKTALAVHWAHRVTELFPDGELYVNLRGYDPGQPLASGEALARFLRALGMAGPDIPAEEEERAARYRSLLAGRRILILLDNARDAEQVRPLLPGTPGCTAVVTSRDTLDGLVARDGARRLDLDALPSPDAVALLRALIGARVDAEPEAAAELAANCCRLPLALRVAAEIAAARPGASLASLAAELADQQQRLDLLEVGGDPRTAVRAVFSWSVRHLDCDAAHAFRLLGIHPGPDVDAYAAAALTGASLKHATQLLDQLRRAHLIQAAGQGRYTMHDLLRDYGRELAAADDAGHEQREALTRLLEYYVHYAAVAMDALYPAEKGQRPQSPPATADMTWLTEPNAARAWLAAELPCLVAVVAHAAAHSWPEHALRLAATIFRYLDPSGHLSEAVTVHQSARRAAQHTDDAAAEARALSNLAAAELRQRRDQDAARHLRQALALSRQTGDRTTQARAVGNLGVLAFWQGRYLQAADYYQQALSLHRETGNRAGEVSGLCNLAGAHILLMQFEQAGGYLQEALVLSRDIGNQDGEAYALLNLGDVNIRQGRDEIAGSYLRQSLTLSRHLDDRVSEAAALSGLGELELRRGRYQHAARQLHIALALARQAGARSSEIDALHLLGEVSLATGDHLQACIHYAGALALASQAGAKHLQARAHDGLARAHHAGRELEQARHHWQQALTLYTEMGVSEADRVQSRLSETEASSAAADRTLTGSGAQG